MAPSHDDTTVWGYVTTGVDISNHYYINHAISHPYYDQWKIICKFIYKIAELAVTTIMFMGTKHISRLKARSNKPHKLDVEYNYYQLHPT